MEYKYGRNPNDRNNILKMWKWFTIGITCFSIIIALRNIFYYNDISFSSLMILGVPVMVAMNCIAVAIGFNLAWLNKSKREELSQHNFSNVKREL